MTHIENISLDATFDTPEAWLDNLMDTYGLALTKLAYSYVQDWGKAQEIVQDVFLTCYEQYNKRHTIQSYKAWIYRITINRAKDYYRTAWFKRIIVKNSGFDQQLPTQPPVEQFLIQQESNAALAYAVLTLPTKYREVILLYYYEELSVYEIATILQCNDNTVKTRLKRARDKLKILLEGRD
ncbi:sigma-70 family RNA polymerase sigma factor [Metasolibacillus meyeri]|uniref:sigma-70 family RNA polymerase sigma factor n=1 Tax=Metasolibacillus meyeri TaxID=1071052 RepID=UPI000D31E822|nr:sigma-70 family RNA polymerase sigma factor [Metasolibacillus meyeri]